MSSLGEQSWARKLLRKDFHEWMVLLDSLPTRLKSKLYYPSIFGSFGERSLLFPPVMLGKPRHIYIGERTIIRAGVRLEVVAPHPEWVPALRIGNNVNIEQNVHIVCHHRVTIGNDVSITANCAIVDTTHPFDGVPAVIKVGVSILDDEGFVEIGDGSFLGIGCVILPNVRIGRCCVIGANSVVTRSLPDYSVAAGAPALVLRTANRPGGNVSTDCVSG